MPDMTDAQRGAYERLPPTVEGQQAMRTLALTAAAADFDLNALWGEVAPGRRGITVLRLLTGGAWFSFQSSGGVAFIRFKPVVGSPGASAATGCIVEDGRTEEFWITSTTCIVDAVGSGAMNLKVWQSSRNYTRITGQ